MKDSYKIERTRTGLGLVAVDQIPKGTRIIEYFGPFLPNDEVERRRGKYFFGVNSKWSVDGSPRNNIARYINHSCRPNYYIDIKGGVIWIRAARMIRKGEELTYDYNTDGEGLLHCRCTPGCQRLL